VFKGESSLGFVLVNSGLKNEKLAGVGKENRTKWSSIRKDKIGSREVLVERKE
jgi:hypothetical protein